MEQKLLITYIFLLFWIFSVLYQPIKTVRYVHASTDLVLKKSEKLCFPRPVCAQLIWKWGHFQRSSKPNIWTKFRCLKTHLFGFEIVLTQEQKSMCTDEIHSTLDTFSVELVFFKTLVAREIGATLEIGATPFSIQKDENIIKIFPLNLWNHHLSVMISTVWSIWWTNLIFAVILS